MTQRIVPPPRTRRELLKLTPLVTLGAMLYEPWRESILDKGLRLSDWASARTFRTAHLAPTYSAADVVPFERFPYNYFDILEPEIDFDAWSLEVSGKVSRPGKYTLAQLHALPKVTQNTRHVCVEGWDVDRQLRRSAAERLPGFGWSGSLRPLRLGDVRRQLLRVDRSRHGATSSDAALLRDVRQAPRSRARRSAAAADPDHPRVQASQISDDAQRRRRARRGARATGATRVTAGTAAYELASRRRAGCALAGQGRRRRRSPGTSTRSTCDWRIG